MDLVELCSTYSNWPNLKGPLELLAKWDGARGIILESHDKSAEEVAPEIAAYLGGLRVDIPRGGVNKSEWPKKVSRYVDGTLPVGALIELGAEKVCLVVREIEAQPEWLLLSIKALMERRARRPFCCIGTTQDASRMNDSVHSFFNIVRKTGRPRKQGSS